MHNLLLPSAIQFLLSYFLWPNNDPPSPSISFSLRHEHALFNHSRFVFSDVPTALAPSTYTVHTRPIDVHRPSSLSAFTNAGRMDPVQWNDVPVVGPDVNRRETLVQLAKMTSNAYNPGAQGRSGWYDLGPTWNTSYPFGWEPTADGLRGHIFVSGDESVVVVSFKGTSASWMVGGGGPTIRKDKLNDNLLFSCCCARVGPSWTPVCPCHSGDYKCDQNCLERSLVEESLFYPIATNLYNNITYMYPAAEIWVVGHSLGGSIAALVGVTFGVPVVAFEAPGEKLAASRLHLPTPPSTQHVVHVIHTADPVPMGLCLQSMSSCALGGYAMESRCHLGKVALYDTVKRKGWSVHIRTHGIKYVLDYVLNEDWDPASGREVPAIEEERDCVDCSQWEFGRFQNDTR